MNPFEPALDVANAVLYEGYVLFPYTASTAKNRVRWQFGVAMPAAYVDDHPEETAEFETVVPHEGEAKRFDVLLRFLQVETRRVERLHEGRFEPVDVLKAGGTAYVSFDGAIERQIALHLDPEQGANVERHFAFEPSRQVEPCIDEEGVTQGHVIRETAALRGTLSATLEPVDGETSLQTLTVRVVNRSGLENAGARRQGHARDTALKTGLLSTHLLLYVRGGRFLSVLDPPKPARSATAEIANLRLWPVLAGERAQDQHGAQLVLASPIILYDFPEVAKRSEGDSYDATEIDELINLSVLSLSTAERDEARATDPRSRAIVERAERFGRQQLERLHSGELTRISEPSSLGDDPFATIDVPSIDCVFVDGVKVGKGSAVRLQPKRRADVWDTFLAGKTATVAAVHQDLENQFYVAVHVDDDPATDLHEWYGRSLFFSPDEIEPLAQEGAR